MKKKLVIIIVIVISLFLIIPIIMFIINQLNINNSYIQFYTAPKNVSISIDNEQIKNIKNKDKITVLAGEHTVKVLKDGFETYTKTITTKTKQTSSFIVILVGITDEAKKQVENETTTDIKEAWASQNSNNYSDDILKKYPLIQYLPYLYESNGLVYKITPKFSNNDLEYIMIYINTCSKTSYQIYQNEALDWIKSKGINPDTYKIEYSKPCTNLI